MRTNVKQQILSNYVNRKYENHIIKVNNTNKREHIPNLWKRSLLYSNIHAYIFISLSALQNLQQPE